MTLKRKLYVWWMFGMVWSSLFLGLAIGVMLSTWPGTPTTTWLTQVFFASFQAVALGYFWRFGWNREWKEEA